MDRASGVSCPVGSFSVTVRRYHATPAVPVLCGRVVEDHAESGKPGRNQPCRSPPRPPTFSGPRAGSTGWSAPRSPWIRQSSVALVPASVTEVRPRGCFWLSSALKSSLWPALSTSTASTLSLPVFVTPDGTVNVVDVALAPPVPLPRYVPLSQAAYEPETPVDAPTVTEAAADEGVKWPRYQTLPWWYPYGSAARPLVAWVQPESVNDVPASAVSPAVRQVSVG